MYIWLLPLDAAGRILTLEPLCPPHLQNLATRLKDIRHHAKYSNALISTDITLLQLRKLRRGIWQNLLRKNSGPVNDHVQYEQQKVYYTRGNGVEPVSC